MRANGFDIRALTSADAAAFRKLRLSAITECPAAVYPTYDEEARRPLHEIEARIAPTDGQLVLGAFQGGELAAMAGLRRDALVQLRHKAVLWGVYVRPAQRQAGLAKILIGRLLDWARTEGLLQVHLCVGADNARAQALYRSLGFETYGREPRAVCVAGQFIDEEHMLLRLDA